MMRILVALALVLAPALASAFSFQVESLETVGFVTFSDDFEDGSLTAPPTSLLDTRGLSEAGGALRFTPSDGLSGVLAPSPFVDADLAVLASTGFVDTGLHGVTVVVRPGGEGRFALSLGPSVLGLELRIDPAGVAELWFGPGVAIESFASPPAEAITLRIEADLHSDTQRASYRRGDGEWIDHTLWSQPGPPLGAPSAFAPLVLLAATELPEPGVPALLAVAGLLAGTRYRRPNRCLRDSSSGPPSKVFFFTSRPTS